MMQVGIDLEQFVRDPYGSGIQRVLQQLALTWPIDDVAVDFVVPVGNEFLLLTAEQAAVLLSIPFERSEEDLRQRISDHVAELDAPRVSRGELLAIEDAWLLPEVSYLPEVLERLRTFAACMPTTMIGYDTLPMTEPANYRFPPGHTPWVSEYFRMLASVDSVVCISAVARDSILDRLRRDRSLPISVAHPGGDHVPIDVGADPGITTFLRLGTLEARKMPIEILEGFLAARKMVSTPMELHFLGAPSASDTAINHAVSEAAARNIGVHWIQGASDAEVSKALQDASMFLSIGVEGYGIPVLEAIRRGTPVLFDGVQPAAELMIGRGARHVRALTADAMRDCFITYAERGNRSELQAELDPESVPAWSEFTRGVIDALYAAHR